MRFNYVDYSENIFEEAIKKETKLYIFDSLSNKIKAEQYYERPFLSKGSLFLTLEELKERVFVSDRLVLKEEKLSLIFFQLLSPEDKKLLKVNDYYDIIDLSAEFFKFYKELSEYNLDRIDLLEGWQLEKYRLFDSLRRRYLDRMNDLLCTDKTLIYDFDNFDSISLDYYEDLVFINLLETTPKERETILRLEEEGKKIEVYNQISKVDYDEEKLNIASLTLPDNLKQDLNIYQSSEEFLEGVGFLSEVDQSKEEYLILDSDFNNSNYHNLLSSKKVEVERSISFTNSNLYRFLDSLHKLLETAEISRGRLKLSMDSLLSSTYLKVFRSYYGLTEVDLKSLLGLAHKDYLYLDQKLCSKELERFKVIIDEVEKMSRLESLGDYIDFLAGLEIKSLGDAKYTNNISQYFASLAELYSIEEMGLVKSWSGYFNNSSEGLFRLVLNYLRFKDLSRPKAKSEASVEIKDLLGSSFDNHKNLIMINISEGIIPSPSCSGFLLTDEQRSSLGLRSSEEIRLKEKYIFFRHILSSQNVTIYTVKDEDRNIDCSSFLEELRLEYNLRLEKDKLSEKYYPSIIDNIFDSSHNCMEGLLAPKYKEEDILEQDSFKDNRLSMSYYKFSSLSRCHYEFYLRSISNLFKERVEFEKKLSNKVIGIIVHEIFESIVEDYGEEIIIGEGDLGEDVVRNLLATKLRKHELKIADYYQKYYNDVLFELIVKSIKGFFKKIKRRVPRANKIASEWSLDRGERRVFLDHPRAKVYLGGRIDLVIEDKMKSYIIDYKTGSGSLEQLDLYSLLYNPDFRNDQTVEKIIYNVMEEQFEDGKLNSEEKFHYKLMENLQYFMDSHEYKNEFISSCKNCEYPDICKVVIR